MTAFARTFETSPFGKIGEVSMALQRPFLAAISPVPTIGAELAISYPTLVVAAKLPGGIGRGGAHNLAHRATNALSATQAANVIAAARHAQAIGLPLNRMITIDWETAGQPLMGMARATGRYLDLLTKWLSRHGHRTAWLWVHENGARQGGHCHLLVHVPAALVSRLTALQRGWLRRITGNPYQANVIRSKPIGGRLGLEKTNPDLHEINLEAAVAYVLKGASQVALDAHGLDRSHKPGGLVIGKRCGWSQNVGAKARANSGVST